MRHMLPILAIFLAIGCGQQETAPSKPRTIKIVAVNHPLAMFASQIGRERVEVTMPVPEGTDPREWQPTPDEIAEIQKADLILLNGAGYAKWAQTASLPADRLVIASNPRRDDWIQLENMITHSHGPGGEHTHPEFAPHLWLDPVIAINMADSVRGELVEQMPEYQDDFRSNFALLRRYIMEESARLEVAVNTKRELPVIFSRPTYQYLERYYHMNGRNVDWSPDQSPDPFEWASFDNLLKEHPAKWMIWESEPIPEIADRLRELGVESVVFDTAADKPAKGDLIDAMRRGADTLNTVYDYEE